MKSSTNQYRHLVSLYGILNKLKTVGELIEISWENRFEKIFFSPMI